MAAAMMTVTTVAAQEPELSYGASAEVEGPIAAGSQEDATAAANVVETEDRHRALESTAEALQEVPGARIQSWGGAGGFAGIGLRGAELDHTSVLLGAIPLNTPDEGAFDLSYLPLSSLRAIEVYRGGAPTWYGDGAVGGVVRFVPSLAERDGATVTAGIGSFGRRELGATAALASGRDRPSLLTHMHVLAGDNDYAYVDDQGTRFDPTDDRRVRQRNAGFLGADGLAHASVEALAGRVSLLLTGHGRVQGVPGPLSSPTRDMRRKLVRSLVGLAYEHEALGQDGGRDRRVQVVLAGSHQRNSVTDLSGELGRSRSIDTDDDWLRLFARVGVSGRVLPFLEPAAVLTLQRDAYHPDNRATSIVPERPSRRETGALALEARLFGRLLGARVELRPSVRYAVNQTRIFLDDGLSRVDAGRTEHTPTYRLAGVAEPLPGLAVSASVASGTRLPSLGELFGDQVYLEDNLELRPERSLATDLGVTLRSHFGELRAKLDVRGFGLWIDDLINYQRSSQGTIQAVNVGLGKLLGVETGLEARYGRHLSLTAALTAMHTESQFGNAIPLRPPLVVLVRPQLDVFPPLLSHVRLFAEGHHTAFVYLNNDDLSPPLPGRTLFAVGLSVMPLEGLLSLDVRINNLLDTRTGGSGLLQDRFGATPLSDVIGRPLPGRDYRIAISLHAD